MCATPCGTTRFSRFLWNSFLRFDAFLSGACTAASCCGSFAKSVPSLESCRFPRIRSRLRYSLLACGDFLLCRDGTLPRSLAGARVCVRALAAHRQIAPVAQAAVALNFDEAPDIHLDLLAEISFDAPFGFDGLAELVHFLL